MVDALALSSEGSRAETAQHSGIWLYDTKTGKRYRAQQSTFGTQKEVYCLAFSSDGCHIATGSWTGDISIWNVTTGTYKITLAKQHSAITSLAFSPDCRLVASGFRDGTVGTWNFVKGENLNERPSVEIVVSLLFLLDRRRVVSVTNSGAIAISDAGNGNIEQVLKLASGGMDQKARVIACSPNGRQIACGAMSIYSWISTTRIDIWDTMSQRTEHRVIISNRVSILPYSSDSLYLAAGAVPQLTADQATIKLWKIETGELEQSLICRSLPAPGSDLRDVNTRQTVTAIAFSHDQRWLAAATSHNARNYHSVELWDIKQSGPLQSGRLLRWIRLVGKFAADEMNTRSERAHKMIHNLYRREPTRCMTVDAPISLCCFSLDDAYLVTSHGVIHMCNDDELSLSPVNTVTPYLYMRDRCLCYGDRILLMLPTSFDVKDYDICEDSVTIASAHGRLTTLEIDTEAL